MRQAQCRILASGSLTSGHCLLEIDCTPLGQPARAGQFLMVRCGDMLNEPLRHPLFFSRGGRKAAQLLFAEEGPWQRSLTTLLPEETIDAMGPLGQPFVLRPGAARLLVLVLSEPVAPALAVAHWAQRQQAAVTLLLARQEWSGLADLLPDSAECSVAQGDTIASLGDTLQWADQLFAVAKPEWHMPLADAVANARLRLVPGFASVFVPSDFACGTGACGACALDNSSRHRRICADGPTFDLLQLI